MKQRDIENPLDRISKSKHKLRVTANGIVKEEYLTVWQKFIRKLKFWNKKI